jgi:hypothetical protein
MSGIPMQGISMNENEYVSNDSGPAFQCSSRPIQIQHNSNTHALHPRSGSSASDEIDQFLSAEPTPRLPFILPNNRQRMRKPAVKVQAHPATPLEVAKTEVMPSSQPRSVISLYIQEQSPQERLFRLRQLARKKQKIQSFEVERNCSSTSSSKRKPATPSETYSFILITSW